MRAIQLIAGLAAALLALAPAAARALAGEPVAVTIESGYLDGRTAEFGCRWDWERAPLVHLTDRMAVRWNTVGAQSYYLPVGAEVTGEVVYYLDGEPWRRVEVPMAVDLTGREAVGSFPAMVTVPAPGGGFAAAYAMEGSVRCRLTLPEATAHELAWVWAGGAVYHGLPPVPFLSGGEEAYGAEAYLEPGPAPETPEIQIPG